MHQERQKPHLTTGRVLHGAFGYDVLVWILTRGRAKGFRLRLLRLARAKAGERMLDIGCGTGSLVIEAGRLIGPECVVSGIDPSPEMIARARRKARRASVNADFQEAAAERLPFPEAQFDLVTSTLMLHHLPKTARQTSVVEAARVLKPGGRFLAVDFAASAPNKTFLGHLHRRHGHTKLDEIVALVQRARLEIVETGPVGLNDLNFVLATKPAASAPSR
jgi:ubiquinone/menaquinone biosynthesis C-methylase UbiE